MSTDDIGEGLGPMTTDTKPDLTGTGDLIKRLAIRAVENGECAAQVEIADPELRASLIRNIEATFADALKAAARVIAPFARTAEDWEKYGHGAGDDHAVTSQITYDDGGRVEMAYVTCGHFRAARDWLAAHATGQRQERADALAELAELDADLITGQRQGGDDDSK